MAYEEIEFPFQFEFPIFSEVPAPCMYAIKVKKAESNFCDMLADLEAEGYSAFFCKSCNYKSASVVNVTEEDSKEDEEEDLYEEDEDLKDIVLSKWKIKAMERGEY